MAAAGSKANSPTTGRNIYSNPSKVHPGRRPIVSVKRQRRNRLVGRGAILAVYSEQTGPAGNHQCSLAHTGPPAMSRRPVANPKQRKNPPSKAALPLLAAFPASMDLPQEAEALPKAEAVALAAAVAAVASARVPGVVDSAAAVVAVASAMAPEAAALAAAVVAVALVRVPEAAALAAAVVAVASAMPPEAAASAAAVAAVASVRLPEAVALAAQVLPRIPRRVAAPLAAVPVVQPEAVVSAAALAHLPEAAGLAIPPVLLQASPVHRKTSRKQRRPPKPAQQERRLAAPDGLPIQNPDTAGIGLEPHPSPQPEDRGPVRHSRNGAKLAVRSNLRCCPPALSPVQQERRPAVLSDLPSPNPGMAGMGLGPHPSHRPERRGPARYSRNRAGLKGRASLR